MSDQRKPNYEYQCGGSLPIDHPTYVERKADNTLLHELKAEEFCFVINARQMGKSSLRIRTMQRLQDEGFTCVTINLDSIGRTPKKDWYKEFLKQLATKIIPENNDNELNLAINSFLFCTENIIDILKKFTRKLLLKISANKIFIFIDEIDCVRNLTFNYSDFFVFIQDCYNKESISKEKYLIFALFGNAHPSDLLREQRVKFNIGKSIHLEGFKLDEIDPLAKGLENKVQNPYDVLRWVLDWTNGQPVLTQKICKLIQESEVDSFIDKKWIDNLVQRKIINNWEKNDSPDHLRPIRHKLLDNEKSVRQRLAIYQVILQNGQVEADESLEQRELILSGLVFKDNSSIIIFNKIYEKIFNKDWVQTKIKKLRPYAQELSSWLKSQYQDESQLLIGKKLQEVLAWKKRKNLGQEDNDFLYFSAILDTRAKDKLGYLSRYHFDYELVMKEIWQFTNGDETLDDHFIKVIADQNKIANLLDKSYNNLSRECQEKNVNGFFEFLDKNIFFSNDDYQLLIRGLIRKFLFNISRANKNMTPEQLELICKPFDKLIQPSGNSNILPIVKEILKWSNLQEELTEIIIQIFIENKKQMQNNTIEELINSQIIKDWKNNKAAEHLMFVRNRILENQNHDSSLLLRTYQKILLGQVNKNLNSEIKELQNIGLVKEKQDKNIEVSNPIYQIIFNEDWIKQELNNLKPYGQKFAIWLKSKGQDLSSILDEQEFEKAEEWVKDNELEQEEQKYLFRCMIYQHCQKQELNN